MITVGIINYESGPLLGQCLERVVCEGGVVSKIIVVDNSPSSAVARKACDRFAGVEFVGNDGNRGFAGGANQIIRMAKTPYVLILNPDILVNEGFCETLCRKAEADQRIGVIGGKLIQEAGTLDSAGICFKRNRRVYERGFGEADVGAYADGDVFAICGAAVFLRKKMLEDIRVHDEWFDEDFFLYHEDTDLSWRARLMGWRVCYVSQAVARHLRGWKKGERKTIPFSIRRHSFKNHYLEMVKNETAGTFLRDLPFIVFYEILRFAYVVFREPLLLRGYFDVLRLLPKMWRKRREIMRRRRVPSQEISRFFKGSF